MPCVFFGFIALVTEEKSMGADTSKIDSLKDGDV